MFANSGVLSLPYVEINNHFKLLKPNLYRNKMCGKEPIYLGFGYITNAHKNLMELADMYERLDCNWAFVENVNDFLEHKRELERQVSNYPLDYHLFKIGFQTQKNAKKSVWRENSVELEPTLEYQEYRYVPNDWKKLKRDKAFLEELDQFILTEILTTM